MTSKQKVKAQTRTIEQNIDDAIKHLQDLKKIYERARAFEVIDGEDYDDVYAEIYNLSTAAESLSSRAYQAIEATFSSSDELFEEMRQDATKYWLTEKDADNFRVGYEVGE